MDFSYSWWPIPPFHPRVKWRRHRMLRNRITRRSFCSDLWERIHRTVSSPCPSRIRPPASVRLESALPVNSGNSRYNTSIGPTRETMFPVKVHDCLRPIARRWRSRLHAENAPRTRRLSYLFRPSATPNPQSWPWLRRSFGPAIDIRLSRPHAFWWPHYSAEPWSDDGSLPSWRASMSCGGRAWL